MSIAVSVTAAPITASASGSKVDAVLSGSGTVNASVSGGVGPAGPAGPSGLSAVTITGGVVSPLVLELTQQVAT